MFIVKRKRLCSRLELLYGLVGIEVVRSDLRATKPECLRESKHQYGKSFVYNSYLSKGGNVYSTFSSFHKLFYYSERHQRYKITDTGTFAPALTLHNTLLWIISLEQHAQDPPPPPLLCPRQPPIPGRRKAVTCFLRVSFLA